MLFPIQKMGAVHFSTCTTPSAAQLHQQHNSIICYKVITAGKKQVLEKYFIKRLFTAHAKKIIMILLVTKGGTSDGTELDKSSMGP